MSYITQQNASLSKKNHFQSENEQKYALDRLVRGVGSSRTSAKTGFYTVLVSFLTNSAEVTVADVFEAIDKHLSTGGSNSKSENADICMGRILSCGALIHSGRFATAGRDEKTKIVEILLTAGSKRSYLTLASYTFLTEILGKCDEAVFREVLWPAVKGSVAREWREQTVDTLYFLMLARKMYPATVKSKFLNRSLGSPEVVHGDSVAQLCNLLLVRSRFVILNTVFSKLFGFRARAARF